MTFRVAVLASGNGSNFEALCMGLQKLGSQAQVALLICNVPNAGALARAERLHVKSVAKSHRDFSTREAYDAFLDETLQANQIDAVCLAGYMRLLGASLTSRYQGRMLNVHPSLLPSFPGLHAVRQALEHKVCLSGCSVHFVDAGLDTGPLVAQAAVPVLRTDTEETLAARILVQEHRLYPLAVDALASGNLTWSQSGVQLKEPIL
jgi:phosphoribosylglycinamide formyltransferase 1